MGEYTELVARLRGRDWLDNAAADAIEAQAAEIVAFRRAVLEGTGPSCEDVCLRECIGVCGAAGDYGKQLREDDIANWRDMAAAASSDVQDQETP